MQVCILREDTHGVQHPRDPQPYRLLKLNTVACMASENALVYDLHTFLRCEASADCTSGVAWLAVAVSHGQVIADASEDWACGEAELKLK